MKKNIILLLVISVLLLIILSFLIYISNYNRTKVANAKVSQEYILKIEKGKKLIDKKLLLHSWTTHNKYVDTKTKLDIAYANALKKLYFALIFLILLQLILLLKIFKHNKSLDDE